MSLPEKTAWAGRRVCVTGGTGFLGLHLVRRLLELGADVGVHALPPRSEHPVLGLPVRHEFGDIRDPQSVRRAVAGSDVVFHAAGLVAVSGPAVRLMHEVHEAGTRNVLAAAGPGVRVVHTSSLVAVGSSTGRDPVTEDSPFNLDGCRLEYVQAKRNAERLALAAAELGSDVVVVNPAYLVGPDDTEGSVMGRLCARFWKGRLPLSPPGGFNLVDVRDVADGHLLAAERGRSGRRYLLGGEDHDFPSLLRLLAEVAGFRPRWLPRLGTFGLAVLAALAEGRAKLSGKEPYPSFGHVRLNRHRWFCNSDRARAELGYHARPVRESLADAHRWFVAQERPRLRRLNRWWLRPAG
jgi:dihydroflavonol-4-reductase